MSAGKLAPRFEDVGLPKFYELANSATPDTQVSAYAQESLTSFATHLRCALVIGETTTLPLKVQAAAVARLLGALAEDLQNLANN